MSADRVTITGIEAFGFHGVLPEEREHGQPFLVDLAVHIDVTEAADADDLTFTVDYSMLAREAVDIVEGDACALIETVAVRIAKRVLMRDRVQAVEVTLHKPKAPVGVPFSDVAVTVERTR